MGHVQRLRRSRKGEAWQAWQARYRGPDGRERSRTFARKLDAERWLALEAATVIQGRWVDPAAGRLTFGEFASIWVAGRQWKDTTSDLWPRTYARVAPALESLPLATIDRMVLEGLQVDLSRRYARSTVAHTMRWTTGILRAAHATGRIGRDPTVGLEAPKARAGEPDGRVHPEDVPTREEVLAILAATPPRFRAAVALGVTGLRIGEVMAVTRGQLDLERRLLVVDRQLQRTNGKVSVTGPKEEKVREVGLPAAVALELRRHLREYPPGDDGLLFRGERGAMLRREALYTAAWRPALRGAGLGEDRFVFHSLRHFCASQMLAEGAPITAVAGHLGDTVATVQTTYVHWLRDDRRIPSTVLDRVLAPPSDGTNAEHIAASGRQRSL